MGDFGGVNSKDEFGEVEVALVLDLLRRHVIVVMPASPVHDRVAVSVLDAQIQPRVL